MTNNGGCDIVVTCTDATPSSGNGFVTRTCGQCPTTGGFLPVPTSGYPPGCADVNECQNSNGGCDPVAGCTNTHGSFYCNPCPAGYSGLGNATCKLLNPCDYYNGGCDPHVTCTQNVTQAICGNCPEGMAGDGYSQCYNDAAYGALTGRVVDALTNFPLTSIIVVLSPAINNKLVSNSQVIASDNNGAFSFPTVRAGCYTLDSNNLDTATYNAAFNSQPGGSGYVATGGAGPTVRGSSQGAQPPSNPEWAHAIVNICINGGVTTTGVLVPVSKKMQNAGQMRVVMNWPHLPLDMDLLARFTTSPICQLGFYSPTCDKGSLDQQITTGGDSGAETITIDGVKEVIYHFFINKFSDEVVPSIYDSRTAVDVYVGNGDYAVASFPVPTVDPDHFDTERTDRWWSVFCIDGSNGANAIVPQNIMSADSPALLTQCNPVVHSNTTASR